MAFLASLLNDWGSQEEASVWAGPWCLRAMLTSDSTLALNPAPGQGRLWHSAFAISPQKTLGLSSVVVTHKFQAFLPLSALGGGNVLLPGPKSRWVQSHSWVSFLMAHSPAGPVIRAWGQLLPVLSNLVGVQWRARPADWHQLITLSWWRPEVCQSCFWTAFLTDYIKSKHCFFFPDPTVVWQSFKNKTLILGLIAQLWLTSDRACMSERPQLGPSFPELQMWWVQSSRTLAGRLSDRLPHVSDCLCSALCSWRSVNGQSSCMQSFWLLFCFYFMSNLGSEYSMCFLISLFIHSWFRLRVCACVYVCARVCVCAWSSDSLAQLGL